MLLSSRLPTRVQTARKAPLRPVVSTRVSIRQTSTVHAASAQSSQGQRRNKLVARFRNGGDTSGPDANSKSEASTGDDATLVPVVFELCKHCSFGHAFALVGDAPQLGEWDVGKALKLEWSEGDVWRGEVSLPLDSTVCFKYVQVDSSGGLVAWGQDIAGGSNMSVLISPSDEVMSGLQLVLDPPETADSSQQPYLVARLDISAILLESAARFKEAQAQRDAAAAAVASLALDASAVSLSTDDEDDVHALAAEPSADYDDSAPPQLLQGVEAEGQDGLDSWAMGQQEQLDVAGGVLEAEPGTTAESAQEAGLQAETYDAQPAADEGTTDAAAGVEAEASLADPLAAATGVDVGSADVGGADAALADQALPEGLGVSAGGVSAGFEDAGSVGAAVASGLMEAGDDETAAGPTGPATPTATPASSDSSSSVKSFMLTSTDLEQSLSDSDDTTADISSSAPDSVIDSTSQDLNTQELLQATAQESARLASTHEASAGEAAAVSAPSNDSRGSLEGLGTAGDSNSNAAVAWDAMSGAKELPVPDGTAAAGCRPPTPNSKLVGATASITTVDPDTPLMEPTKTAITELDSSVKAVQPVDSYEDMFGALAAAAAVAATSSMDGHDHGREGSEAKGERAMQLVSAEQDTAAAGRDGEGTGTWTGGAAAAPTAAESSSSGGAEPAQRATESSKEASAAQEGSGNKKQLNWFQRLLGGGGNEDERA